MSEIKELKEVLAFGLPFAMVVDDKLQDGFQWTDVLAFVPVMTNLPAAIDGIENVDDEIENLDEQGRLELMQYVQDTFELPDDFAEAAVEQGIRAGVEVGKLVLMLRKIKE